ncbi:CLUMA_CG020547, isoform A [Clunio marinus]|uniref:CLUMA_CG020547, isoform A n=1 Tax=Clunio marinus TaxID=568069 RepID=A0A1J1J7X8_9DIPT|nr:CLUMA_CG020547, isoform A [Clunio marinus]
MHKGLSTALHDTLTIYLKLQHKLHFIRCLQLRNYILKPTHIASGPNNEQNVMKMKRQNEGARVASCGLMKT